MVDLNGNGRSNMYDYVNLLRYLLLTCVSILLGYTISDWNPDFYKQFTTPKGQFALIFVFLVTGLVKFKNNPQWKSQVAVMACVSAVSVYMMSKMNAIEP